MATHIQLRCDCDWLKLKLMDLCAWGIIQWLIEYIGYNVSYTDSRLNSYSVTNLRTNRWMKLSSKCHFRVNLSTTNYSKRFIEATLIVDDHARDSYSTGELMKCAVWSQWIKIMVANKEENQRGTIWHGQQWQQIRQLCRQKKDWRKAQNKSSSSPVNGNFRFSCYGETNWWHQQHVDPGGRCTSTGKSISRIISQWRLI